MTNSRIALFSFILLLILAIRFFIFYQGESKFKAGQTISLETVLFSDPTISGNYQKINIYDKGERIELVMSRYPEYFYGDRLQIKGIIKKIKTTNNSSQKSKLPDKKRLVVYFPQVAKLQTDYQNNPESKLLAPAFAIRQNLISFFEKNLHPDEASLLLGIVFGIKRAMSPEFLNSLRLTGVMHVVAASGLNVSLLGGFLSTVLVFFFKRPLVLAMSVIGILFYVFLSGFQPSIIRASIMGSLAFSAQIIGRQHLAAYSLFLAGFSVLFWDPSLLFDIGFQLSYLATLGLLYINPLFLKFNLTRCLMKKTVIGSDIATSLSAQIITLPILLINFGSYSPLSLVANGLLLWTIPFLMIIGGIGAALSMIYVPLGRLVLYLTLPFLIYFEKIVSFISGLRLNFTVSEFNEFFAAGYYLLLLALVIVLLRYKKT